MRLVNAAVCLGAAGVLAACGGGASSSSPPPGSVSVDRTVTALRSGGQAVCLTTTGGEVPGIKVQATTRLVLDCRDGSRTISVYAFDDPNVAFAVAGGGVASGDDVWLLRNLTVAGVALTSTEASRFDRTMRSLGAHRYQAA